MKGSALGPGTIVLGGGALLLIGFLVIGALLPSSWEAGAERVVDAAPADIAPLLDSPEGWRAWTTWPDSGLARSGPERGAGARIAWDDPELGSGSFTVSTASADSVTYAVEVSGAAGGGLSTRGVIRMSSADGGTLVRWHERGDLGGNPLMGWWARFMGRAQSAEMAKGLDRLAERVRSADGPSR